MTNIIIMTLAVAIETSVSTNWVWKGTASNRLGQQARVMDAYLVTNVNYVVTRPDGTTVTALERITGPRIAFGHLLPVLDGGSRIDPDTFYGDPSNGWTRATNAGFSSAPPSSPPLPSR